MLEDIVANLGGFGSSLSSWVVGHLPSSVPVALLEMEPFHPVLLLIDFVPKIEIRGPKSVPLWRRTGQGKNVEVYEETGFGTLDRLEEILEGSKTIADGQRRRNYILSKW